MQQILLIHWMNMVRMPQMVYDIKCNPTDNLKFDLEDRRSCSSSELYIIPILFFVCQYWDSNTWSWNSNKKRPEIDGYFRTEHFDKDVDGFYTDYDMPYCSMRYEIRSGNLSNWYVRL
jgi:hypothetical protein